MMMMMMMMTMVYWVAQEVFKNVDNQLEKCESHTYVLVIFISFNCHSINHYSLLFRTLYRDNPLHLSHLTGNQLITTLYKERRQSTFVSIVLVHFCQSINHFFVQREAPTRFCVDCIVKKWVVLTRAPPSRFGFRFEIKHFFIKFFGPSVCQSRSIIIRFLFDV